MKFLEELRAERREGIIYNREATRNAHNKRGRHFIKSKTTRKVFRTVEPDYIAIEHDQKPYPHSSTRQQARYARQIAAGQLRMDGVDNG